MSDFPLSLALFKDISFYDFKNEFSLGYGFDDALIAYINGDDKESLRIILPNGVWKLLISTSDKTTSELDDGKFILEPKSGALLVKE